MFHRFDNWFDRISDGWNPVTVRDLRRLKRSWFFVIATISHVGLLLLFLHLGLLMDPFLSEEEKTFFSTIPTCAAQLVVVFLVIGSDLRARLTDELFVTVPLPPKEKVHGVLGTSCLVSAFFVVQALPFLLFSPIVPYSALMRLGILLGGFVVTQILVLHLLSFSLRIWTTTEVVIAFLVVVYPLNLNLLILEIPFLIMFFSWIALSPPDLPEYVLTNWLFIAGMSSGGVLALATFAWLNYRLALYHCGKRSGSYWRVIGVNLLCLAVWSSCWASLGYMAMGILCSL